MVQKYWEVVKTHYCERVGCKVALEAEAISPPEHLPDQPPRLRTHRCSHGVLCNPNNLSSCLWSGTNPDFDPFER